MTMTMTKLVLPVITNRNSHERSIIGTKLSVTLDDLKRHNVTNRCVILFNLVAFWVDYVKVVEDTPPNPPILSAAEM